MAKNYVQEGDVLDLTAPYAVSSGDGAQVGSIFGVAVDDLASGDAGPFARCGVFDLTALTTATGAQGAKAYWDNVNRRVDTDGTVGILIGALVDAKTNGQTIARVALNEAVPDTSEGPQAAVASLTENAGAIGGTNNGDLPDLTATAAPLTGTLTGTANGAMVDIAAAAGACAGGATPAASDVDTAIATAVATIVTGINEQLKELQTQLNAAIVDNVALRAAVRELAAKQNATLVPLRTAGIIAAA